MSTTILSSTPTPAAVDRHAANAELERLYADDRMYDPQDPASAALKARAKHLTEQLANAAVAAEAKPHVMYGHEFRSEDFDGAGTPEAQAAVDTERLMASPAYLDPSHREHRLIVDKVARNMRVLHPED
jgi:hypothetical protein